MSMLLMSFLLQAAAQPGTNETGTTAKASKICREMLVSSSRVRPVRVCKTRAAWQRWERCHSATRYCTPPTTQTLTMVSLPGDKLICKFLKTTGSRLEQQKICATKRQWEIVELETQETVRNRQNQSMRTCNGGPC